MKHSWKKSKEINCPACKKGLMFDVSSRLAMALRVQHTECDLCHYKQAKKFKEE